MRVDAMGLLRQAAMALNAQGDGGHAYAVLEMANNLRLLMRGEDSVEEWNKCYAGADRDPLDIDAILPSTPDMPARDDEDEEEQIPRLG